jgi:hypothetical protein
MSLDDHGGKTNAKRRRKRLPGSVLVPTTTTPSLWIAAIGIVAFCLGLPSRPISSQPFDFLDLGRRHVGLSSCNTHLAREPRLAAVIRV